jgi:hypothetical protein
MRAMKLSLLALALSVPAFAGSPALDALRAVAGPRGDAEITTPAPVESQAARPASAASMLSWEFATRASCYDGSDREIHGAPMCALALSNDPSEQNYVTSGLYSRAHGGSGELSIRRETKLFAIGRSTLTGYVYWAVESRDIVVDADGEVLKAQITTPKIYASASACPSCAFQPYEISDAGATKTVLIGRTIAPMTAVEARKEVEKTLAAIKARP